MISIYLHSTIIRNYFESGRTASYPMNKSVFGDLATIPKDTYFEYKISMNSIRFLNTSYGVYEPDNPAILIVRIVFGSSLVNEKQSISLSYRTNGSNLIIPSDPISIKIANDYFFEVEGGKHADLNGSWSLFGKLDWQTDEIVTICECNGSLLQGSKKHNEGEKKLTSGGYQEVFYVSGSGTSFLGENKESTYYFDLDTGVLITIRGSPCDYLLLVLAEIDWIWGWIVLSDTNYNLGPTVSSYVAYRPINPILLTIPIGIGIFVGIGVYSRRKRKCRIAKQKLDRGPSGPRKRRKKKRR